MNFTNKTTTLLISIAVAHVVSPASAAGPTTVRTPNNLKNAVVLYDSAKAPAVPNRVAAQSIPNSKMPADTICNVESRVAYGDPAPHTGGGTLGTIAPFFDTTINSSGNVAFGSTVVGSDRNQGFFISNSDGTVNAVAIGCGDFGGGGDTTSVCGDPSPIGGKISGLFFYTPSINNAGDVVFISDVNGGSARRALFVFHAATRTLEKVAAPGDPSPIGGVFDSVSPGVISNSGKVFFLALPTPGSFDSDLFMWENGVVTKVAATGDPAPGGGTYSIIGSQSVGYVDGTSMPIGPLPDINDSDVITFRAIVSGGITDRGIIVRTNGVDQWYVKVPDPTPAGGTYLSMEAPSINNAGQVSFFADYHPTPDTFNSGWFAGAPGNWRKVLVFGDSVDGGEVLGLAISNNPEHEIDAAGNVFVWANLDSNGTEDRLLYSLTDGSLLVVARNGDPTPLGGTFNGMSPWPTIDKENGGIFGAYTPGAQGGVLNAYFTFEHCADAITLQARVKGQGTNHNVQLKWSPADGGRVSLIRNGSAIGNTTDDGRVTDKLGTQTGSFTYKICETDSGDCSNEVTVTIP